MILIDEWRNAHDRHGWAIGRYVIIPDHVHFLCRAELDAKTLPKFMQRWKELPAGTTGPGYKNVLQQKPSL